VCLLSISDELASVSKAILTSFQTAFYHVAKIFRCRNIAVNITNYNDTNNTLIMVNKKARIAKIPMIIDIT
jgi:hypothetical protein